MLLVASFDNFVRPDEEHTRKKVSTGFEARLIAELLVHLELLLGGFLLLLFHY